MRGNVLERDGIVLPDAAPADDVAFGIGEGDRVFAPLVPHIAGSRAGAQRDSEMSEHIAGAGEGRQRESEKAENDEGPEGRGIIEQVDDQPAEAGETKTVEEGGKG